MAEATIDIILDEPIAIDTNEYIGLSEVKISLKENAERYFMDLGDGTKEAFTCCAMQLGSRPLTSRIER